MSRIIAPGKAGKEVFFFVKKKQKTFFN